MIWRMNVSHMHETWCDSAIGSASITKISRDSGENICMCIFLALIMIIVIITFQNFELFDDEILSTKLAWIVIGMEHARESYCCDLVRRCHRVCVNSESFA